MQYLNFEKSIAELEGKVEELKHLSGSDIDIEDEVLKLKTKIQKQLQQTYSKLTPWQKTQVARHPDRPHTKDYIFNLFEDFTSLAGDRLYGEDHAIIGGLASFQSIPVMVMGTEKGHDTETRLKHNFGMAKPEGYRKAQRLMKLAERFSLPVITFVDTAGAYPGKEAEERGQAEAIAASIRTCLTLKVPLISFVIGEGGSGGAIALAAADRVLMLEHSIYSVISPEGCASILWRDGNQASLAADSLKLTAQDLIALNVIDGIIEEPLGAAHRNPDFVFKNVRDSIRSFLNDHSNLSSDQLVSKRNEKFISIGQNI